MQCENEDEACDRDGLRIVTTKDGRRIKVCKRCYNRYENHGDGRKLAPWDDKKGRAAHA